jgi:hypothetical protein
MMHHQNEPLQEVNNNYTLLDVIIIDFVGFIKYLRGYICRLRESYDIGVYGY